MQYQLNPNFVRAVVAAIAIREEYRETGVVVENEPETAFSDSRFVLIPVGLERVEQIALVLQYPELEMLARLDEEQLYCELSRRVLLQAAEAQDSRREGQESRPRYLRRSR